MLTLIYLIAITAEAMTGALAAGRRNMDIFGVAVIAFLTALGGGTVRDIVLGRFPIGWTQHPEYIYLVLGAGLIAIPLARHIQRLTPLFLFLDALGLVAFTVIGCDVALGMGYATPVVVMKTPSPLPCSTTLVSPVTTTTPAARAAAAIESTMRASSASG